MKGLALDEILRFHSTEMSSKSGVSEIPTPPRASPPPKNAARGVLFPGVGLGAGHILAVVYTDERLAEPEWLAHLKFFIQSLPTQEPCSHPDLLLHGLRGFHRLDCSFFSRHQLKHENSLVTEDRILTKTKEECSFRVMPAILTPEWQKPRFRPEYLCVASRNLGFRV